MSAVVFSSGTEAMRIRWKGGGGACCTTPPVLWPPQPKAARTRAKAAVNPSARMGAILPRTESGRLRGADRRDRRGERRRVGPVETEVMTVRQPDPDVLRIARENR